MSTDADLLRRYAADRCEAAFAELVRRHIGLVYSAALRQLLGNHRQAQEVTQEVFTLLARKAPSLTSGVVLAGWLYSSTRFTVANVRRAEKRRRQREQQAYLMSDNFSGGSIVPDWENLRPVIDDIVQSLGRSDREAIVLRFFQGQPYTTIAATLQVSDDAARRRIDRALEKLRAALSRRGFASSSGVLAAMLTDSGAATPDGLAMMVSQHALATSSFAGAAGTGFLHFMATSKMTLGALGLFAIIAGGLAWHEYTANVAVKAAEAIRAREYQVTAAWHNDLNQALSAANAALQKAEISARPTAATGNAGAVPPVARIEPKEAGKVFIARHPEVLTALREMTDASTRAQFREMYRLLSMTPDEIQTFERLQREGRSFGRSLESGTISIDPGTGLTRKEEEARIRDLLGPERMSQYDAYLTATPSRNLAANLSSLLVGTESPLTTDQARQLADTFAAQANPRGSFQFNWAAALAQAQPLLSPAQLEMLKAMQVRSQGWQQVLDATQKP